MRTEKEVRRAISHLAQAMLAAPEEERDGPTFRSAYMVFAALSWVLGFSYDPGCSELDDEQPIHVRMTLGDYRKAQWLQYEIEAEVDG